MAKTAVAALGANFCLRLLHFRLLRALAEISMNHLETMATKEKLWLSYLEVEAIRRK